MDFDVIIPARYGSSRLPGKVLLELGGRPMIQWVYEAALAAQPRQAVVATDDQRVFDAVKEFGGEACMTAGSHASGTERLAEAVELLNIGDDAIVVNLQGDEPLLPPNVIRQVAATLAAESDAAIATASHAISEAAEIDDPDVVKVVTDARGRALYFSRQAIPYATRPVQRHIGVYAYRAAFLRRFGSLPVCALEQAENLEQLRALYHGEAIAVCEAEEAPGPGVDTAADLEAARAQLGGA